MYVQGATGADARAPLHALSLRSELLGRSLTLSDIHADTPCLVGTLSATEALVGTEKKAPDYRVAALCRTGLPAAAGLAESQRTDALVGYSSTLPEALSRVAR